MSIEDDYRSIVAKNEERVIQEIEEMKKAFIRSNLLINKEPYSFFFEPCFLSKYQERKIKQLSEKMAGILNKITRENSRNDKLHRLLGYDSFLSSFIHIDPGYNNPVAISRLDLIIENGTPKFIEFNTDSPGSMAIANITAQLFMETTTLEEVSESYKLEQSSLLTSLSEEIKKCYTQFGKEKDFPTIALVDWEPIESDIWLTATFLRKRGFDAFTVDPRKLKHKSGKLVYKNKEIDVVYKRAIVSELMDHKASVKDFLAAVKSKKTCIVNNFQSIVPNNKKIIWLLRSGYFDNSLNSKEKKFLSKHLPWTYPTTEKTVEYKEGEHELEKLLLENKDEFVLKPSSGYGGAGVMIGLDTPSKKWNAAVKRAVGREDWIAQEYLKPNEIDLPVVKKNGIVFEDKKMNINPHVFNNSFKGCLARASEKSVINLHGGGAILPTFVYSEM
ncbi:glutathionylspermidine synthase family protein [archaeon]|nr:glutathionylspermidine synthase family protein [archaeon]